MELAKARTFIDENNRGILMTNRQDSRPQMSPILIGLDGEGRGIISSRETAYKVRNLRRDPSAYVCIFTDEFFGEWIQIEGTAEIVSLPEAMDLLVDYYKRVSGEHPDWEEYRQAMKDEQRVLIRITLERAGPDKSG